MSRIRSIHPGFATDEDFITVSRDARLFFVLLLTECDDQGVFLWKPLTLKMRLFPADNVDVEALCDELLSIDAIINYETAGRQYGAVRNFRKYQRPKSPNAVHPLPNEFRKYVCLSGDISEIADVQPPPFPGNGEIAPQMEEGGDKREDGRDIDSDESIKRARTRKPKSDDDFEHWYDSYPHKVGKQAARTKYAQARKQASVEQLLDGLKRYISSKPPDRQWCNPATWLNQERWLDQPELIIERPSNGYAKPSGTDYRPLPKPDPPRSPPPKLADGWRERLDDEFRSK